MTIQEDLLRAAQYGTTEYYRFIQAQPTYLKELARTQTDYLGHSWIESPFKFPRFSDAQFEDKRIRYQAKYGNKVTVPGWEDILHWKLPARITTAEMAAHRYAIRRGAPSPLTYEQQQVLKQRRVRFLSALASPTPTWIRNVASVQNALDDAEDALTTAAVLGRLAARILPRFLGHLVPIFNWTLIGSEIINLGNIFTWVSFSASGAKRSVEQLAEKNPFHKKAAAARAARLKRIWPSFGEALEILQTTDQIFGIGLCLGSIIGLLTEGLVTFGEGAGALTAVQQALIRYQRDYDKQTARQLTEALIGTAAPQDVTKDTLTALFTSVNSAIKSMADALSPNTWLDLKIDFRKMLLHAPTPTNPTTIEILQEAGMDPYLTYGWPYLDKKTATVEELVHTYSPIIKDRLQDYALRHQKDLTAMVGAWNTADFTESILSIYSDDGNVRMGRTAYANAAIDMQRDILIIPPDTPQDLVDRLADWIGSYERQYGDSPNTKQIELQGKLIGIKWTRSFPRITFEKAARAFPQWQRIQELLKDTYIAD